MSIQGRLSAAERRAGITPQPQPVSSQTPDTTANAINEELAAIEAESSAWLLACSETRRFLSISQKFTHGDFNVVLDHGTATPDEIELAKLILSKAHVHCHCDRAALNQQIRELEARVNVYNPIVETGTRPPLTEAERQSLDRFWASLPTLPPGAMGPTGPRYRGMPQEEEDYRNFLRLSRVLPVGEL